MSEILLDSEKKFDRARFEIKYPLLEGENISRRRLDEGGHNLIYPNRLDEENTVDISDCYFTQAEIDEPAAKEATVESILAELDGLFIQDVPPDKITKALRLIFTELGFCDSAGEIGA